ncbi:MAG: regulatory protein RecX [Candidatus Viridilinea halotolerans]|uniref:Regulatory protein RecX n=1 Tax=Candidatus Viridilinea halotolerans TaxID=2491704 RepID=A0A426U710_9CHLR|nr:MAG: regulatory protein RecX [Candidatus Viridilinea halotolerans]
MPPGTITAITAQANDSQRVNIFIDGAFALGIGMATLAREALWVGLELDEAAWERLEAAAQAEQAMRIAMRMLDSRPRAIAEVRQRLQRKGCTPESIAQAIERLTALGLLDDSAFSQLWVENRQRLRPRGALALRDELRRKGVDRTTVEQTLAASDATDPEAEAHRAEQLARSVLARYAHSPDRTSFQRRMGGFLQRRGFSLAVVRPILGILWAELQGADVQDGGEPYPE